MTRQNITDGRWTLEPGDQGIVSLMKSLVEES